MEAEGNTWSRSARRTRRRIDSSANPQTSSTRQPALTCSVRVIERPISEATGPSLALEFQWLYGTDRTLFESFASHVWRKVGDDVQNENIGDRLAK